MKISLTKGLDKEAAQDVRAAFLSSHPLRKQLTKLLEERIDKARKNNSRKDCYDEPGDWSLKMADSIGYERSQRELIALLNEKNLDDEK